MSKTAYQKGVVLIKCDGCEHTHLIADHLGWFEHGKPSGTIEDILARKGEKVTKMTVPQFQFATNNSALEFGPQQDNADASASSNDSKLSLGLVEVELDAKK